MANPCGALRRGCGKVKKLEESFNLLLDAAVPYLRGVLATSRSLGYPVWVAVFATTARPCF